MNESVDKLTLYLVMNSDGHFFRAKGRSGLGDTWVTDAKDARIYAKIGPARASVSFFANNYPEYPAPKLVKIGIGSIEILDESERVAKQKLAKEKTEANYALWEKAQRLKRAEKELEDAKRAVKELKGVKS